MALEMRPHQGVGVLIRATAVTAATTTTANAVDHLMMYYVAVIVHHQSRPGQTRRSEGMGFWVQTPRTI
jgi:hypothetical protein